MHSIADAIVLYEFSGTQFYHQIVCLLTFRIYDQANIKAE